MNKTVLINSMGDGGAQRQVSMLLNALDISQIIILSNDIKYKIPENVHVISLSKKASNSIIETLKIPYYVIKAQKYLQKDDLVISFLFRANIINILVKKIVKTKAIISERNHASTIYNGQFGQIMKWIIKKLYPKADKVIPNSNGLKQDLIDNFNVFEKNIQVINNALDLNQLKVHTHNSEYDELFKGNVILSVGRLVNQKRPLALIKAFKQLAVHEKRLIFIGDGPLRRQAEKLVQKEGLTNSVFFLGYQENIISLMSQAKVLVLCSECEGFPNVILESLYAKLPVIACDCRSGPKEILDCSSNNHSIKRIHYGKYGILIPDSLNNDKVLESNLSESIEMILNNQPLQEKYKDYSYDGLKPYSKDVIINHWEKVIEEAVK